MNCRNIQNDLVDYLEGKLNPVQQLETEDHLTSCKACHEYSLKLKELLKMIEDEKVTGYDPFMFTRIQTLLQKPENSRQTTFIRRVSQPILIAVIVLIIVYTGISIGRSYNYQNSITRDYETELYYLSDIHSGTETILLIE